MKRLRGSAYPPIVIMVVMLLVLFLSLQLDHPSSRIIPIAIASFVFILAAIQLGKEITAKRGSSAGDDIITTEWRRYLPIATWIIGFILATYLAGFVISIPLFILLFMKWHGSRWLSSVTIAILFTAMIYFVFVVALELPLYKGILFI